MLTKIFSTGEGKGYGTVEYLCADNPFGKGERRTAPQIVSGDPALIRRQIDAVPFKQKYTSGVHSFAPEDMPTDDQIMEVIEATEELAFAGLPLSSRSILWVRHEHAGRTELHFLIPRQEVNTGMSFNAFPPGWEKKYDHLRDKFNYKYGWARPEDPERARHWQPGINAKILHDANRREKNNPKAEVFSLTDDLANMAIQGKLVSRIEIVSELRRRGYGITRQGKDYLTIVDKEGKRTRLKGTLFEENFYGPEWIKFEKAKFKKSDSEKKFVDLELSAKADRELQEAIRSIASYNNSRYHLKGSNDEPAGKQTASQKNRIDTRGNAKKMGLGIKNNQRTESTFTQSPQCKANASDTFYSEQRLGESTSDARTRSAGNYVQIALRKIPFSEQPLSGLGRREEEGSTLERKYREAAEQLHGERNRDTQDSFRTGSRDHQRQPGEPGRDDAVDNGDNKRIARESFQSGEFDPLVQNFRKNTQKLEKRLNSLNQAIPKLPDFDLKLSSCMEKLEQAGQQTIIGLSKVNENKLLKRINNHIEIFAPTTTNFLLTEADNAIKLFRSVNEQKLFQKLGNFENFLIISELEDFSRQAAIISYNLASAYNTKILANIYNEQSILQFPHLYTFALEAQKMLLTLRCVTDIRQVEEMKRIGICLELPGLKSLALESKITSYILSKAKDYFHIKSLEYAGSPFLTPELNGLSIMADEISNFMRSAYERKILSGIWKSERKRRKLINNCFSHAAWAGSDLHRWNRIFDEYEKSPKKMKILNELIADAHGNFLEILTETQKMGEIQAKCGDEPFMKREYAILDDKMKKYNADKNELIRENMTQQEKLTKQIEQNNSTPHP